MTRSSLLLQVSTLAIQRQVYTARAVCQRWKSAMSSSRICASYILGLYDSTRCARATRPHSLDTLAASLILARLSWRDPMLRRATIASPNTDI